MAIDLNAVPPTGIEGVEVGDKAVEREGSICYGAIGVGDTKMKIHKAAIARLFEANNQVLDAEEIFALALTRECEVKSKKSKVETRTSNSPAPCRPFSLLTFCF